MRDHAPVAQGGNSTSTSGFLEQEQPPLAPPQSRILHDGHANSHTTTQSSTANNTTSHSTATDNGSQSVIDKLQSNVQASVREATGKQDPDVAAPQPSTSIGKRILEGVGLGGDERQTTISKQVP